MSDERVKWSYIDENGVTQSNVPVSVQGKEWASGAAADKIHDPNQREESQPRTEGWFNQVPFGDEFNFSFRRLGLMLGEIEGQGMLQWSAATNYNNKAVVWGSDGLVYFNIVQSGPGYGGAKDPVSEPFYWRKFNIFPDNFKAGLIINPDDADPVFSIYFSPGKAKAKGTSFPFSFDLIADNPIIKKINVPFTEGSGNGGLFPGANIAPLSTLHAFTIIRNDGLIDAGFDDDIDAAHLPSNYFAYFRAGSFFLDGSSEINRFNAKEMPGGGVSYMLHTPFPYVFLGTLPVGRQILTIEVPKDIKPVAQISIRMTSIGNINSLFVAPTDQPVRPNANGYVALVSANSLSTTTTFMIDVDESAFISWEIAQNAVVDALTFTTRGWLDKRLDE